MKTHLPTNDTIYALATPIGGAIAVIRLSGGGAIEILRRVFTGKVKNRFMAFGQIVENGEHIDDVMGTCFLAPNSYTGEDMAEIYAHGGQQSVRRILAVLARNGARPARPGEFTERAFLNGKMDLAQAEAVMDFIGATAERSAKSALAQLEGKLSGCVNAIEEALLDALSGINAAIDYPEELEEDVETSLPLMLDKAIFSLSALIEDGQNNRVLREGAEVPIIGRPNVGKSSLLNALLGEERSIVTRQSGTTRDVIEGAVGIEGIPVRLFDTAGIRETHSEAEAIGVERAKKLAQRGALVLLAFDGSRPMTQDDHALTDETENMNRLAVVLKCDLPMQIDLIVFDERKIEVCVVSSLTCENFDGLRRAIATRLAPHLGEGALVTNARHIDALIAARDALNNSLVQTEMDCRCNLDCIATDVRAALYSLGVITGRTADTEVIERIFARFCVGK